MLVSSSNSMMWCRSYVQSWFTLDLISAIPWTIITPSVCICAYVNHY